MRRVSRVDACMICGDTPCSCGKPKRPTPQPVAVVMPEMPKPKPVVLKVPQLRGILEPTRRKRNPHTITLSDDEMVLTAALRNVADILAPEERDRLHSQLMTPPTIEERIAFWKAQRRDAASDT